VIETLVVLGTLVMAAFAVCVVVAVVVAVVVSIVLAVKLVLALVLLPLGLMAGEPFSALLVVVGGVVLAARAAVAFAVFMPLLGGVFLALAPLALVAAVVVGALRARTVPAPAPASLPAASGRLEA
jgi:hypothetical protein